MRAGKSHIISTQILDNRFFISLLILGFVILSRLLPAQEYLSLQQAISQGLENNYSIRIARNDAEIADNNASLGNAGFLPNIDLAADKSKSVNNTNQKYVTGNVIDRSGAEVDNQSASVSLNWTIFDGFKMFVSYGRLQRLKNVGEINSKIAVENSVSDIIDAYFNVVQQQQQRDYLRETAAISKERLGIASANYKIGAGSKLDMLQAQVDLNADSSTLLIQETALNQAKIALNRLLARDVNTEFVISDSIELKPMPTWAELQNSAYQQNSVLQNAREVRRIAELDLKNVRGDWLPDISLNGGYNWSKLNSQSGFLLENRSSGYTYGVTLSMNLFNGFNTYREVQNAKINIRNSRIQLNDIQNQLEADLANSYENYRSSVDRVQLERINLGVAKQTVDISLKQLRLGTISAIQFRESQRNYLNAESRFISALYEAKSAETALLRLSGKLIRMVE